MRARRPSSWIALRSFWLTTRISAGVASPWRTTVSPRRSLGSFESRAWRMNVRRMPSAAPKRPASKTTLSRGEAWPTPGDEDADGVTVVQSSWAKTKTAYSTSRESSTRRSSVLTPGLNEVVHGSTTATSSKPRASARSILSCLPDEPRNTRGLSIRSSARPRPVQDGRPPATDHEVVEQSPELALDVHVSVGSRDQGQVPVRREPCPDPPARQIERDRQADDQRRECRPDDPLPRVLLRDQERVVGEAAQVDPEVHSGRDVVRARGQVDRVEPEDLERAVGIAAGDGVWADDEV